MNDFAELDERVATTLEQFTYKPGWEFTARVARETRRIGVEVSIETVCSKTGQPMVLHHHQASQRKVNAGNVEQRLLRLIRDLIYSCEVHELDEWCRYNGYQSWDPHKSCESSRLQRPGQRHA